MTSSSLANVSMVSGYTSAAGSSRINRFTDGTSITRGIINIAVDGPTTAASYTFNGNISSGPISFHFLELSEAIKPPNSSDHK